MERILWETLRRECELKTSKSLMIKWPWNLIWLVSMPLLPIPYVAWWFQVSIAKDPILQEVISLRMQLWPVAHFFSSKLDFPVIKTLERDFFTLSEWNSNVLITGKSNFDEKSGQLVRVAFVKKLLLTELGLCINFLAGIKGNTLVCASEVLTNYLM